MSSSRSDGVTQFFRSFVLPFVRNLFFLLVSLKSVLYLDVFRMLQGCFKKVSRVFQESFKGVSMKFQGSFKCVLRMFQVCFKEVSRMFQGSY